MQPIVYDDLVLRPYEHGSDDKKGYIIRNKILSHSTGVDDRALRFVFGSHDSEADRVPLSETAWSAPYVLRPRRMALLESSSLQ